MMGYPAMLGRKGGEVPSLLVAGASDAKGVRSDRSNHDPRSKFPSVYAPGYLGMKCAHSGRPGDIYYNSQGGTSMGKPNILCPGKHY